MVSAFESQSQASMECASFDASRDGAIVKMRRRYRIRYTPNVIREYQPPNLEVNNARIGCTSSDSTTAEECDSMNFDTPSCSDSELGDLSCDCNGNNGGRQSATGECKLHPSTHSGHDQPHRLRALLEATPPALEVQQKHGWNPDDRSSNIVIFEDQLTMHRLPVAQSTDAVRGRVGYETGLHAWEICWPVDQRGTHAVVGVATANAPLHAPGYCSLVGSTEDSWGWELGRNRLFHNTTSFDIVSYPTILPNWQTFLAPEKFTMILDMDDGTLSFMDGDTYLGVAFRGLKGKKLFPMTSAVWGHCQIKLTYLGGLKPEPRPLADLCRRAVRGAVGGANLARLKELPLPLPLIRYLHYRQMW